MLERAAQSRSRLKLAVFTSIGISVVGLTAMLIGGQGCKREEATPPTGPTETIPPPAFDPATTSTSLPPDYSAVSNNTSTITPPPAGTTTPAPAPTYTEPPPPTVVSNPPTAVTPPEGTGGARDYVIQKGDTFASIAKKENLSPKAIEKANPGVDPRRLKINQKIVLPPPATAHAPTATAPAPAESENTYIVKSGDNFSTIAKKKGLTAKAIEKANPGVDSRKLKVNQKLVLPAKASGATAPAEPATAPSTPSAPAGLPVPGAAPTTGGTPPA